jgi:hypothetical protein
VDCWIGVVQPTDRRLVSLAGRLSAAQVPELPGVCAEIAPLQVDLTELVSAGAAGIEAAAAAKPWRLAARGPGSPTR